MRRYRRSTGNRRSSFKRHRHSFKIGSMKGLTSIPLRFRTRRL